MESTDRVLPEKAGLPGSEIRIRRGRRYNNLKLLIFLRCGFIQYLLEVDGEPVFLLQF